MIRTNNSHDDNLEPVTKRVLEKRPVGFWQLVWRRFRRHRLGVIGGATITILVLIVIFADFLGPYDYATQQRKFLYAPPTKIHFFSEEGFSFQPFVYGLQKQTDPQTLQQYYIEDFSKKYPIRFFVQGEPHKLLGLIPARLRFFGTDQTLDSNGQVFLFGTDKFGRDIFSRTLIGGRVSLAIGPFSLIVSLFLGILFGGLSGYLGGWVDMLIQRLIEVIQSFPTLPLFLALAAILPAGWSPTLVFFGIIFIFSFIGWTGVARVLRGQFLALREQEFAIAAKAVGASNLRIIFKHLVPNSMSYLIVVSTLAIPGAILGESGLSFLGLGIREPMTSWGLLLNQANNIPTLTLYPWLFIPSLFIVLSVLAFNSLGDALRDAFDPYSLQGTGRNRS
jgi:peptide/nickel transport system permease protein